MPGQADDQEEPLVPAERKGDAAGITRPRRREPAHQPRRKNNCAAVRGWPRQMKAGQKGKRDRRHGRARQMDKKQKNFDPDGRLALR